MISADQLTDIGNFVKPHGINGELSAVIDSGIDIDALRCIILDIDGIFVPFFISSHRSRGAEAMLLTIDGITNEIQAKPLSGKTIYTLTDELPEEYFEENEDGFYASDFIGWTVVENGESIGEITGIDDSTENVLFIVESPGNKTIYIPVADEFIDAIDTENHIIDMSLPTGICDL